MSISSILCSDASDAIFALFFGYFPNILNFLSKLQFFVAESASLASLSFIFFYFPLNSFLLIYVLLYSPLEKYKNTLEIDKNNIILQKIKNIKEYTNTYTNTYYTDLFNKKWINSSEIGFEENEFQAHVIRTMCPMRFRFFLLG